AERRATAIWEGSLTGGHGTISTQSGVLKNSPVTWASRVEAPEGKTSPEELLAAAQAECYAMVLAHLLGQQGKTPERIDVSATATVEQQSGGLKITEMYLQAEAQVQGMNQNDFQQLAEEGERSCPISNALRGNVKSIVKAQLHT
ncbi:MAG: OsmC family peroxiredoxin, partial [Chloroflexota bacterium]